MLRKLLCIMLALMLAGMPLVLAEEDELSEDLFIESPMPDEPVVIEGDFIRVTSEYLPSDDLTRYTAELINAPAFADGTAVTAEDLLFSLYVYLDPDCPVDHSIQSAPVPGLESYRRQISGQRLTEAAETLAAIHAAGEDHIHSDSDAWTAEHQSAYWTLHGEYLAACEAEFINCARAIVDYCADMPVLNPESAFGCSAEDVLADEGLRIAHAMQQWGYASADDGVLTSNTGKLWYLSASAPALDDFVHELSAAYNGDLAACWAVESTGTYTPDLPDLKGSFMELFLGSERDFVPSVSGIRLISDAVLEIDLQGIDMYSAGTLFGLPVLSLAQLGDADQWSPEEGLYGHPFGDMSCIGDADTLSAAIENAPILLEYSDEIIF